MIGVLRLSRVQLGVLEVLEVGGGLPRWELRQFRGRHRSQGPGLEAMWGWRGVTVMLVGVAVEGEEVSLRRHRSWGDCLRVGYRG